MIRRIAVSSNVGDARARHYLGTLKTIFPDISLSAVATAAVYTIDARLSSKEFERAAGRLANSLTETYSTQSIPHPQDYAYAIEIGYLPGVTDNVGKTARETIEDSTRRKFRADEAVYSSTFLFLSGTLTREEVEDCAHELHNQLIERVNIYSAAEVQEGFPIIVPKVKLGSVRKSVDEVDLDVSDEELSRIGKEGIRIKNADGSRRGPLALSLSAMKVIRAHFKNLDRNPTDVELEALAQTWSEHCKHTIFADPLDEVGDGIYHRYIKGATQKIRAEKGKNDFCVSVFTDNSGGIAFDEMRSEEHTSELQSHVN